ncbi:protoheme IX farnesyltransferase [Alicyclobacillus ferrooxydans]|uniref:Protoheme IX farnesyltransferase n=2 Tax=Alicyclobacillus ferrooxydans TaxID=471514 RepID=A0A0P9D321_9BACL|nr:protoheme IX farnesyltransferase [Alicyclobacillus ferrooxydans]
MKGAALESVPGGADEQSTNPSRGSIRDYISVLKLGITVANVMATISGLWVGSHGHPDVLTLIFTVIGTAMVVAGGAALNNYVDRDIDHRMTRTQQRATVSGKVNPTIVFWMGLTLGIVGTALIAVLVNVVAAACAFGGLIVYSYIYTVWLKRTTTLSTVLGGVAGALPPLIGFAAGSHGSLGIGAWVLFFIFFLWQPPHFLPLAMKRTEEYRAAGIPMLPVVRGFAQTKQQILLYTAAMFPVSLLLYGLGYEGIIYLVAATVLGLIFLGRAVQGLFVKDDLAWSKKMFGFSLLYLTAMCIVMIISAV